MATLTASEIVYTYTDFDGKLVNVIKVIKNGIATIKQKLVSKKAEHKTLKGMIVKPNHKGQDQFGRIIDWTVYTGAIACEPYDSHWKDAPSQLVRVVWFGEGKEHCFEEYYLVDLTLTGRYWDKMK